MAAALNALRQVDLNLLVVLASLLETRSVANTAAALSLTPSAVSHALGRLRQTLGDELFVRTGPGLAPTPLAASLKEDVQRAIDLLSAIIVGGRSFDPAAGAPVFRLGTTDIGALLVLPKLLAALAVEAPGAQVVIRPLPEDIRAALAGEELDAVIGMARLDSGEIYRRRLFSERTRVLARVGHPRLRDGAISLEDYLACEHILVAPRGRPGSRIDAWLAERNCARRIAALIPEFVPGPHLVAGTDLLLSAGDRLLRTFERQLPVQVVDLPFALEPFDVDLLWHARVHGAASFQWFRGLLVRVHAEVYGPPE